MNEPTRPQPNEKTFDDTAPSAGAGGLRLIRAPWPFLAARRRTT